MVKKSKDKKSRRRRGSGTRTISKPILLIVQGEYIEAYSGVGKTCLH